MESLGADCDQASLSSLTTEIVTSSELEGESLSRVQVRSSLARRLGLEVAGLTPSERRIEGLAEIAVDATRNATNPVTEQRLFAWHAAMFPSGRSGMSRIRAGAYRDDSGGPMQVVSGRQGREVVHFEAPAADVLPGEVARFLEWLEAESAMDPVLKAALAHLWFLTLHPFDDGNGRLARVLTDLMLARSEASSYRFYSMSAQIRKERDSYYSILESTQNGGTMDITAWLLWFLNCLERALGTSEETLQSVLRRSEFWRRAGLHRLNERQRQDLQRLLEGSRVS